MGLKPTVGFQETSQDDITDCKFDSVVHASVGPRFLSSINVCLYGCLSCKTLLPCSILFMSIAGQLEFSVSMHTIDILMKYLNHRTLGSASELRTPYNRQELSDFNEFGLMQPVFEPRPIAPQ